MKLTYLKILNYRNLSGQEIRFNPSNNFIVGENNLGKSNLLLLLNTLFRNTYRSNYDIGDFADQDKPIEVTFSLLLDDIEIGLFDDLFDSDETNNHITVRAIQASPDDNMEYWHDETNQKIPASSIKCINYLYYDSQRNPDKELTFDKSKGVGRFLNHLVQRYLTKEEVGELDFVDENKVAGLIKDINLTLCKIKAFKDYNINASLEQTIEDLLAKLILLKDSDDRHLNQSGYGVQFLAVISLFILEKLLNIGKIKSKKGVFGDAESKSISLVVGLDEPEIHLHPFLQRSLIKYIHKIINNQDEDFTDILKDAFGINSIIGQTIIATHSPSILLNKYTEIVRLYIKEGKLRIKSGSEIQLDAALQKHLQMQFPFIKEAFFARSVIVVEGDTELASFPYFAIKLNSDYDFDNVGVTVIKAGGNGSVEPIMKLLDAFDIPAVGIVDKDDDKEYTHPRIRKTKQRDIEAEIVTILDKGREDILLQILTAHDTQGVGKSYEKSALEKIMKTYPDLFKEEMILDKPIKLSDIDEGNLLLKKLWYLTWLVNKKDILLGAIIGEVIPHDLIPEVYKQIIEEAIQLAKQ